MRTKIVSQTIPYWFDITTTRISSLSFHGRYFSVKELSWCAPKDSPVRRRSRQQREKEQNDGPATTSTSTSTSTSMINNEGHSNNKKFKLPIDHFGIVAAMCSPTTTNISKNNNSSGTIIGINGKLPWEYLPTDRMIFERLTRNRILIVGRRTLLEERKGNLDHIRHAKYCIVVSKSILSLDTIEPTAPPVLLDKDKDKDDDEDDDDQCILKLARSFEDAVQLARELSIEMNNEKNNIEKYTEFDLENDNYNDNYNDNDNNNDNDNDKKQIPSLLSSSYNIQCWVAGGEKLYEEALKHKSASELHISVVDMEIDLTSTAVTNVTRFPSKYRWDHNYEKISETRLPFSFSSSPPSGAAVAIEKHEEKRNEPNFNYHIYKRIIRQQ
jgi:dihydrofolate reductase